jgi:hypothetical protein
VAALAVVLAAACLPLREPHQTHVHVAGQRAAATGRHAAGEDELARTLARGVLALEPQRVAWADGIESSPSWQGVNRAARRPRPASGWRRALLWLPDRLLDLCDLVSFDLGLGVGLGADVHATRSLQLGASAGASLGVGWHPQRSLGLRLHNGREVAAGPWGRGFLIGFDRGTGNARAGGAVFDGLAHTPESLLAQEWRDHWAVGARAQLLLSAEVDLHLYQIWDLLAGVVGFDPSGDDLATSAAAELTLQEELGLVALRETLASAQAVDEYRAWIAARDGESARKEVSAAHDGEALSPPADGP